MASTAPASSTAFWRTHRPSTSAGRVTHPRADPPSAEALLTAARDSANPNDFALVCLLGLLGLRIFEACGANITDLGEEHGHRVLKVHGKGGKTVLIPLPPAVARAVDRAAGDRTAGALLRNRNGARMDRHAAIRRLRILAVQSRMRMPTLHRHMLRHTFVTTMQVGGVASDATFPSSPPTWPPERDLPPRPPRATTPARITRPKPRVGWWIDRYSILLTGASRARSCRPAGAACRATHPHALSFVGGA
jgi:hypothetical protein